MGRLDLPDVHRDEDDFYGSPVDSPLMAREAGDSIVLRATGEPQGSYTLKTPTSPDSESAVGPRSSIGQSCSGKEGSLSGDLKLKADPGSSPGVARPLSHV